jgi:hypothetical protein
MPDPNLTECVIDSLRNVLGDDHTKEGMGASGDSFYCSEGRNDPNFND